MMKNIKYTRDSHSKALLLADKTVIDEFLQKKSMETKLQDIQNSINILKTEVQYLKQNILELDKKSNKEQI